LSFRFLEHVCDVYSVLSKGLYPV